MSGGLEVAEEVVRRKKKGKLSRKKLVTKFFC
jgi:hypothetical protein